MKKKVTVTVGIPAFNEEKNIGTLLTAILAQSQEQVSIEKIFVLSDASTDNTNKIVQSIMDERIILVQNPKRLGQIYAQNYIFRHATSDVVVLFEADTFPQNRTYIENIVQVIQNDIKVGLVQGRVKPLRSRSWIGKILNKQIQAYETYVLKRPHILEWQPTGRGGRAFTKAVYTKLVWPNAVPEDVYALLWCKKNKIKTVYEKTAICRFRSAQTLSDLLRERQKIHSGELSLEKYFSQEYRDRVYRPFGLPFLPTLFFLWYYPVTFFGYALLKFLVYRKIVNKKFTDFWPTTNSTKLL